MKCHECEHENTEGAWLCINCGAKLHREEAEVEQSGDTVEEPSRFEPSISENLRRLRERTTGDQPTSARRRRPASAGMPKFEMPNLAAGTRVLGLPVAVWVIFTVVFIIVAMMLGNLQ